MDEKVRAGRKNKRDCWFQQNLDLAREGDEAAIHILWVDYHIDYQKEGGGYE
jgi:hypothetical protein